MPYETGTATSIEDLVSKFDTFITANGFTRDELDLSANYGTWHETGGTLYFSLRWDATAQTDLAIYQSTGWTSGQAPHQQPDDSGVGTTAIPIASGRRVNFVSVGPFTAYHFFINATGDYVHVVVEVDAGRYRHFGFGKLTKVGDWTGGDYAYGHLWDQGVAQIDDPTNISNYLGLDAGASTPNQATMQVQGLPGVSAASRWMVVGAANTPGTDRAGNVRVSGTGGARGGLWPYYIAWIPSSALNVYIPLTPIPVVYRDKTTTPHTWYWMGVQPDKAIVNMTNFNPGDVITIGADTWMVFPWVRKQFLQANTEESWNAGYAYKKIT